MAETDMQTGADKETMVDKGENELVSSTSGGADNAWLGHRGLNNAARIPFITTDLPVWPRDLCHRQYVSQPWRHPVSATPLPPPSPSPFASLPPSSLRSVSAALSAREPRIIHFEEQQVRYSGMFHGSHASKYQISSVAQTQST